MIDFNQYVGVPYSERGCWELLRTVYRNELGIDLPDYERDYCGLQHTDRPQVADLIAARKLPWSRVPVGAEQPLDAVLMKIAGYAMHIGVVTEPGRFVHCIPGQTSAVESYRRPGWARRVEGFYRCT